MASQPPRRRRLELEEVGGVMLVSFVDKKLLDEQNILTVREQLYSLIEEQGVRYMALNFSNVEFASSAFLGALFTTHKKIQAHGGKLVLYGISKDLLEVFEITKLNRLLNIRKDEMDALQQFGGYAGPVAPQGPAKVTCSTACPIKNCDGKSLASDISAAPAATWEGTCDSCGARFRVRGQRPNSGHTARAEVLSFSLPTFENEWIEVSPAEPPGASTIRVAGRCELFCRDAVESAWQTLSAPRRVLFDLASATSLSPAAAKFLLALCAGGDGASRGVLLLDKDNPDHAPLAQNPSAHTDKNAALAALADGDRANTPAPSVEVRAN